MDQDKIGKTIREIRKNNNLTQQEFANKYGVTYQAVSKWETGKNIPDITLIKKICEDYGIDMKDLLNGEVSNKNKTNKKTILISILFLIIVTITIILIVIGSKGNFEFKTITTTCDEFNITGSIAYNNKKSSIYISDITYCGGVDNTLYKKIECTLYEKMDNTDIEISEYDYDEDNSIKLEDFLQNVTFNIDDYGQECKNYSENSLYLLINATDEENKVVSYKVPLSLKENCPN